MLAYSNAVSGLFEIISCTYIGSRGIVAFGLLGAVYLGVLECEMSIGFCISIYFQFHNL